MNLLNYSYAIVGEVEAAPIRKMMNEAFAEETGLRDAHIVIFTGGTDVDPALYGMAPHSRTQTPDKARDRFESKIYHLAYRKKKCMVGICRGAQFLNVMNGGRLWQHVDGHHEPHPVMYQNQAKEKYIVACTSDHHQMMIPTADAQIWGWAGQSTMKETARLYHSLKAKHYEDPEIVFYKASRSLCFQPHPEWGLSACRVLFLDVLKRALKS